MSRTPRSLSSPADTHLPSPAAFPAGARQGPGSLGGLRRLELQPPALWGGPRAGARCALAVGNPNCSTIALTPRAPFTDDTPLKPASTPQAREHIPGEHPACAARPSPNGVCAPSSAPPPSRQRRGSPPPAPAPPLLEGDLDPGKLDCRFAGEPAGASSRARPGTRRTGTPCATCCHQR
jgi:hypothetical protein